MKRAFDIVAALLALVVLLPLLGSVALLVRVFIGRPVVFMQRRPGLGGRPFKILKFRTMTQDRGDDGCMLPDELRLTWLGRLLRATSLDELPELLNVLRGDMSLVGPRPLLIEYLERYTTEQARRHEVRPGITGWAQVKGRNSISWQSKFDLDIWYVDHQSLRLDVQILWMTIAAVFGRRGINSEGHATMPPFLGSERCPAHSDKATLSGAGVGDSRGNAATLRDDEGANQT